VFTLKQTSTGALVAGTNRGVFMLAHNSGQWQSINVVASEKSYRTVKKGGKTIKVPVRTASPSILDARINDVEIDGKQWIAATSAGLFTSNNDGKTWTGGPVMGKSDFVAVDSNGDLMMAATRTNVVFSKDDGKTWQAATLPVWLTSIHSVTITPDA